MGRLGLVALLLVAWLTACGGQSGTEKDGGTSPPEDTGTEDTGAPVE